jgi:hypothetical protein
LEFASYLVEKATLHRLRVAEVPTTLAKDGRGRPPHLRSWRDGWRHLRFLLMYSPKWLFLYPGIFISLFGLLTVGLVLPGPLRIGSVVFDIHTLLVGTAAILTGSTVLIFFLLAKQYATGAGLVPEEPVYRRYKAIFTIERAVMIGATLFAGGITGVVWAVWSWQAKSFGELDYAGMMRLLIPSIAALALGIQIFMASFLAGILDLPMRRRRNDSDEPNANDK